MSSPIAKTAKTQMDRALIRTHQQLSHNKRIDLLAGAFASQIRNVQQGLPSEREIRLLDVGCGDMTLAEGVANRLGNVELRCVDIHPCPPSLLESDPRWQRYTQFDGRKLPFEEQSFDVVMFSDVLHHVPVELRQTLLQSAGQVGRHVIIKDHLEYGWFSRQMLRGMDWVGNFSYGISVPERYFDNRSFQLLCTKAQLKVERMDIGLQLYQHLPVVRNVLSQKWQFFAVCSQAN